MAQTVITACDRCGARCRWGGGRNPDAKMLRRSQVPKGICVNCATHDWLMNTYPTNMMLAKQGPGLLAHQHIRDQFAEIMRGSHSDASPNEINWNLINENWDLPFPHKVKPSAANPCSQEELDRITSGEEEVFDYSGPPTPSLTDAVGRATITSFNQLNELEPGLGDEFKSVLSQSKPNIERTQTMAKNKSASQAKDKDDFIHRSTEPHDLPCKLTSAQKAAAAEQLAKTVQNLDALEDEKKTATKELAERKQRLTADLRTLGRHVTEGEAVRSVECELQLDYNKLTATLIRKDTKEQVGEPRTMNEDEKQMEFNMDDED